MINITFRQHGNASTIQDYEAFIIAFIDSSMRAAELVFAMLAVKRFWCDNA